MLTMPADPVRRDALTTAEEAAWRRDGWALLRGLLAPDAVAALADDVRAVLAARNMPDSYLAQSGEYLAGSPIHALVASTALRRLAAQAMEGEAHLYMPFTAVKGAGQGPFSFHQDGQYTPFRGPGCNAWFALGPCTLENGCLRLVSGSHSAGLLPAEASTECPGHRALATPPTTWTEVAMAPGDCCLFDRHTVHGSGPNRTAAPRLAYAVQFHRADTQAFFAGAWAPLVERPRWPTAPVAAFSSAAGRGE